MSKVLVLNGDGTPHRITDKRGAWDLIEDGVVITTITDEVADVIRTVRGVIKIPSILMLKHVENVPHRKIGWSKQNVLKRDNFTCIYCGYEAFGSEKSNMTVDHIIPQSKGGPDTWSNTACACFECNQRKADKSPTEAGMKLLWEPKRPRTDYTIVSGKIPASWKIYFER